MTASGERREDERKRTTDDMSKQDPDDVETGAIIGLGSTRKARAVTHFTPICTREKKRGRYLRLRVILKMTDLSFKS